MLYVDVTDFMNNVDHYIDLCSKGEIHITKNGNVVAILSNPDVKYFETLTRLCGCLKDYDTGENYKDMIGKEIMRKCGY